MKKYILIGVFFFSLMGLQAQNRNLLKKAIVSPAQIDMADVKSGRSISVITAKEIERMAASSVEEVLANVEGVNINGRGGFGVQNDLGMRGSTFSQVLVLIDNVRVNEPLTGHYNMYLPIALSEIEQIEVVRGPAASAYGADAVGGLIHIKTKSYMASAKNKKKEIGSIGSALLGEQNLRLIDGMVYTKNDNIYFGGSVNVKTSDGQLFPNPNHLRDTTLDKNFRTNFDIKNYSLFANFSLSDRTNLYARTSINTRDFNAQYFYTNSRFDESIEKVNTIWTQVGLRNSNRDQKTEIGLAYKQLDDEFVFNPQFAKNNHTTQNIVAFAQQQRRLSRKFRAAYGWQSVFQQIESSDRGNHKNNTHAAFLSLNYDLGGKTSLNGSARLEHNDNYGTSFIPQLGFAYRPNRHIVVRSSVGMAHRAPDFTERYIATNLSTLSEGRNLGNPDLKAEESITADVGFDYYTKNEKLFSLSVFGRDGTNLIDYILTNADVINTDVNLTPGKNYFYTQNISSATTYGLEAGIQKRIKLGKKSAIRIALNYAYMKTETEKDEPSKYISNHPGHMANMQLGYQSRYFDVLFSGNYRTRKQEENVSILASIPENYFVSNALIRFKTFNGKFNVVGKVLNIFDASYQEILGAPMPRRWFAAGIDWNL